MQLSILEILFLAYLSEGSFTNIPRMTFTSNEIPFKSFQLPGGITHLQILKGLQEDRVIVGAGKHLYSVDFHNKIHGGPDKITAFKKECLFRESEESCAFNITVLQQWRHDQLFLCGTDGREAKCCVTNMSEASSLCSPSEFLPSIPFNVKEGDPSLLIGPPGAEELYIAHSGSEDSVGIHRFRRNLRIRPRNSGKEQSNIGLVTVNNEENPQDNKLYAFYKERNTNSGLDSHLWVPFVAQVCMADVGGPKTYLQFVWTSQLSARLFCGEPDQGPSFSELLDLATVDGGRWNDTRVYALFRNEWGMTAVCVYTVGDIEQAFTTSKFKGQATEIPNPRPGMCHKDSSKLNPDVLRMVEKYSEMNDPLMPVGSSGPLLVSHSHYTKLRVDSIQTAEGSSQRVLFLSLQSGKVHKVLETPSQAFVIAEYHPFKHRAHIIDMIIHASRKLYVASSSELIQVDVEHCALYGATRELCVLARDPYCSWDGNNCSKTAQISENGNPGAFASREPEIVADKVHRTSASREEERVHSIKLRSQSKYFLRCPLTSKHAQYSWRHHGKTASCVLVEQHCLLLMDNVSLEHQGLYSCVAEEMGYTTTLAEYRLSVENRAAAQASALWGWACLLSMVTMILCF